MAFGLWRFITCFAAVAYASCRCWVCGHTFFGPFVGVLGRYCSLCDWGSPHNTKQTPNISPIRPHNLEPLLPFGLGLLHQCALLGLCVSYLRKGHANILRVVAILPDDLCRVSLGLGMRDSRFRAIRYIRVMLWGILVMPRIGAATQQSQATPNTSSSWVGVCGRA